MPRVATKLTPAHKGGFIARKVIPLDVREAYATLYGHRTEERLNTGPMPVSLARAKHREWSSEIEARITNIRAQRKGEGRTFTPTEARALAGAWYGWFTARMAATNWPAKVWEDHDAHVRSELYGPAMAGGVFAGDPLDFWEHDSGMRERVRPIIADNIGLCAAKLLQCDPGDISLARHAGGSRQHSVRADEIAALSDALARKTYRLVVIAAAELCVGGDPVVDCRKRIAWTKPQCTSCSRVGFFPAPAIGQRQAVISLDEREVRIQP
jgi:hypothetical protein